MEKNNEILPFDINDFDNPLKLKWDETTFQYKVNKPLDQSGEYIGKVFVESLIEENKVLKDTLDVLIESFPEVKKVIQKVIRKVINKEENTQ